MQIDWTRIPRTKLRRPDMLESAIADGLAGADYLAHKFPNVPLILGGFSFGGPTVWAVARRLQAERPGLVGGLVAMAGSARGGELYEEMGVDTAASVRTVSAAGVPVQFVHGTHDKNVALQVAEFLYKVRGHRCSTNTAPWRCNYGLAVNTRELLGSHGLVVLAH